MLEKSFGLLYYLKQAKNQKDGKRYVYLRITVDGDCREISTKRQSLPNQWNSQSGRAIGDNKETEELNSYLDLISCKVYQAKIKLLEGNKLVTAENIKDVLIGKDEKKHFIMEAFQLHNKQMKYRKDDLEVKELDYEFVSQFVFWLKTERHCRNNTAIKYLGNFKKIILECKQKGLLTNDPFLGFRTKRDEVIPVVLTKDELTRITNKQFDTERLNHVRDIFLFSCYTPKCLNKGTLLPVLTNQKMNSYLKEIADVSGVNKKLTFHTARRTFATTIYYPYQRRTNGNSVKNAWT